jgi:hypothetical protein
MATPVSNISTTVPTQALAPTAKSSKERTEKMHLTLRGVLVQNSVTINVSLQDTVQQVADRCLEQLNLSNKEWSCTLESAFRNARELDHPTWTLQQYLQNYFDSSSFECSSMSNAYGARIKRRIEPAPAQKGDQVDETLVLEAIKKAINFSELCANASKLLKATSLTGRRFFYAVYDRKQEAELRRSGIHCQQQSKVTPAFGDYAMLYPSRGAALYVHSWFKIALEVGVHPKRAAEVNVEEWRAKIYLQLVDRFTHINYSHPAMVNLYNRSPDLYALTVFNQLASAIITDNGYDTVLLKGTTDFEFPATRGDRLAVYNPGIISIL